MITLAALSPSLDLTYLVDDLRLGEIHRPTQVLRCAGGKSLNMGRAAATLGADVAMVAVLGGATGDMVRAGLLESQIELELIDSPAETRVCVSIASAEDASLTEIYQHAPEMPWEVWQRLLAAVGAMLARRPGWLSISGAPPRNLPASSIADLVRLGHRRGARVAVDTHGPALAEAVAACPAVVKINRSEAGALLGAQPEDSLLDLAKAIRAATGGLVVLTDGREGAVAVDEGRAVLIRPPSEFGRFPVGSGDAFLGGLLAAFDTGAELDQALRTASAAGTANALVPGPGNLEAAAVAKLIPTVHLDWL